MPSFFENWDKTQAAIVEHFPSDLVVEWRESQLTTNIDPVVVPWSDYWSVPENWPAQALVISPESQDKPPAEIQESLQFEVLAIATQDQLFIHNLRNDWASFRLEDLPGFESDFEVTSDTIDAQLSELQSSAQTELKAVWFWSWPIFYVALLLEAFFMSLTYSFFIWLFGRIGTTNLSWNKAWQFSVYLTALALLIQRAVALLTPGSVEYLSSLAFWILFLIIFNSIKTELPNPRQQK